MANRKNLTTQRIAVAVILLVAAQAGAHTLFFKPDSFFLTTGQDVMMPLINGTFVTSENRIPPNRMLDATIVAPDGSDIEIADDQWSFSGNVTNLSNRFEQEGNYVIGVGTRPMMARVAPENFNFYLRYEGLEDDAKEREAFAETDIGAAERYQKFSKTILQVGNTQSENYDTEFGYPVEIVPLQNPYELEVGDTFRARILKDGAPLINEFVYATHEGHYDLSDDGIYDELVRVRSDENGEIDFVLQESGRWYIRFIHLTRMGDQEHWYSGILVYLGAEEQRIPYESFWATLTFEVR